MDIFLFTIKLIDGTIYDIKFNINNTVLMLKYEIDEQFNIPTKKQRLIIYGQSMENHKNLKSYNIMNATVIHLVINDVEYKSISIAEQICDLHLLFKKLNNKNKELEDECAKLKIENDLLKNKLKKKN